jgi:hypothetical protein
MPAFPRPPNPNAWGKLGDSTFGMDTDKVWKATQLLYDYLEMRLKEPKRKGMNRSRLVIKNYHPHKRGSVYSRWENS